MTKLKTKFQDKNYMLQQVMEIGADVAQIKDVDLLLEKILTKAREITNADAGSIYTIEKDILNFRIAQNNTQQKLLPPGKKLIYNSFSIKIDNSTIAGYVANTGKILNISDVYLLDQSVPYSFGKKFDEQTNYRTKSMLTLPLKNHLGKIIGVLQIINALDDNGEPCEFDNEVLPIIEYFANSAAISLERAQMTREIILRMIKMAELRDPKETGAHVNRVAAYSIEIYENWALKNKIPLSEVERNRDVLRIAAMLHDVGKVGIDDAILKKNAKFTDDEYEIMKTHTILGARLFNELSSEVDIAAFDIALNHHEKWNGSGYPGFVDIATGKPLADKCASDGRPLGKKGNEIPLFARIVAIADVFDALTSARVYKKAWSEEETLNAIKADAGKHFDPELVEAFLETYDTIKFVMQKYQ